MSSMVSFVFIISSLFVILIANIIDFSGNVTNGGRLLITAFVMIGFAFIIEIFFGKD